MEHLEQRLALSTVPKTTLELMPPLLAFDFGTATSPVAAGHQQVAPVTFSPARGYGWQSLTGLKAVDRPGADPLLRDLHRGRNHSFLVNLANGVYQVTPTLANLKRPVDRVSIFAEGRPVAASRGQVARPTFTVEVTDGRLKLQFADGGRVSSSFSLAALNIERLEPPPPTNNDPDLTVTEAANVPVTDATSGDSTPAFTWDLDGGPDPINTLSPVHTSQTGETHTDALPVTDVQSTRTPDPTVVLTVDTTSEVGAGRQEAETAGPVVTFTPTVTEPVPTVVGGLDDRPIVSQPAPPPTQDTTGSSTPLPLPVRDDPTVISSVTSPVAVPANPQGLLQTFTVRETFGVAHPSQILELDLGQSIDPSSAYLVGPGGTEVAYQLLQSGALAVQSDLPAYAERTWTLHAGRAPAAVAPNAVQVKQGPTYYEVTNGLLGVRIALPATNLSPAPAPIQGVRYRDGQWTATGPNYLEIPQGAVVNAMTVRFVEKGPLKVVVEVSYDFYRPDFYYGEQLLIPGGAGYYKSTIEVQADQPSILVEEDTNLDLSYSVDLTKGLHPDQARYRGHSASAAQFGREPDGQTYRPTHERQGGLDAVVDLAVGNPVYVNYYTSDSTRRPLAVWDPWAGNTGWYWQLYNSKADAGANLFGIFSGPASRAVGAAISGVGVYNVPLENGTAAAGLTVWINRRTADGRVFERNRFAWGIFLGTKDEDLKAPEQVQPIAHQMNLHGGVNLGKLQHYQTDFQDPAQGYGALFMEPEVLQRMIQRVRQDPDYYNYLYNAEPTIRPLLAMWRDTSGQKVKEVVGQITTLARDLVATLVHGDGIYDFYLHYWQGGLEMSRMGLWIDQVLASDQISAAERAQVKAAAALFANVLWDDDFVPLSGGVHGLNLGTANMPVQQQGYRDFYALLLGNDPAWQARAADVRQRTLDTLHHIVNESGAEIGSPHYIAASLGPTLNTLLQLRTLGGDDPFQTDKRLAQFAEFYLSLLTPADPRFGGLRKVLSLGDGSTEASALYGVLATGFRTADPKLSARLMGAWQAQGRPHSGFFGSTVLMIDEEAPVADPALVSASFPGYASVLRSGAGTTNETALWLVNGDFYSDHRHQDQGTVVLYALGAPVSLDWSSLYAPQTPGAFWHSVVLPEAQTGHPWNQDNPSPEAGAAWLRSKQTAFLAFQNGGYTQASFTAADGTIWTRSLYLLHANADYPIIVLRDSFTGPGANAAKVFTLNLAAQGAVETPAGLQHPPLRSDANGQLPSAGTVFGLQAGVNRLGFTGQQGVDWDLYTLSVQPQQAAIGNWAHNEIPSTEAAQFADATGGLSFEERQHILRLRSFGQFEVVILPHRQGQERSGVQVQQDGTRTIVTSATETAILDDTSYAYQDSQKRVLAALGSQPVQAFGLGIAGGPAEVVLSQNQATLTITGEPGLRTITLPPGNWKSPASNADRLALVGGQWQVNYQGGPPLTLTLQAS